MRPDHPKRTAIPRKALSAPTRWLQQAGLIDGRPALDYGCGRGKDAELLGLAAYDPHHGPKKVPDGWFEVILCTYVLNVVPEAEATQILDRLRQLLTPSGVAYVTVRRDMPHDYVSGSGLVQRRVVLDLPTVHEDSKFCIYEVER